MALNSGKIGWKTGASIVVANMIGTGVFTSLGFQLPDIQNTYSILLLWVLGGVLALSGAFSYAEIGTAIKESGGEYTFLSRIYHPIIGYLSGWISLTVGFAAPVALAAIAFSDYFNQTGFHTSIYGGIAIIILLSIIHSVNIKTSSVFQNFSTVFKIAFILIFLLLGFFMAPNGESALDFSSNISVELFSAPFAIALIYVSYSYTGWNAAAYITEEFGNIRQDLPKALISATLLVTILYTSLQFVFLKHAPYNALVNQVEVGAVVAQNMFSPEVSKLFSGIISLLLISSISAMIWVGPRVSAKMSKEHKLWSFLQNTSEVPWKAIWLQAAISILLILTGTFEQILIYCGILLNFSSALVVGGVFLIRKQAAFKERYKSPAYPIWQILFLIMSVWIIIFAVRDKPFEVLIGLSNIVLGLFTYFLYRKKHL